MSMSNNQPVCLPPGHALRCTRAFRRGAFITRIDDILQRHQTLSKPREERMMADEAYRRERVVSQTSLAFPSVLVQRAVVVVFDLLVRGIGMVGLIGGLLEVVHRTASSR